ncbi:MAG: hypothetical protein V4619_03695 [Bacteroidota bacterium]
MTRLHTASGIFRDMDHAEDAKEYLLGQEEFLDNVIEIDPVAPNAAEMLMKVHADSAREMQEIMDVLRNYGAVNISTAVTHEA